MSNVDESMVEDAALSWFRDLGYAIAHGPHMAPGEPAAERNTFADVVLTGRLLSAIQRLNPTIPAEAQDEALRKILRIATPSLIATNRAFHTLLRDGVAVEYRRLDGSIAGDHARLIDFHDVSANDWLAVNQFTVIEGQHTLRIALRRHGWQGDGGVHESAHLRRYVPSDFEIAPRVGERRR